jgi:hypothetical protein
MLPSVLKPRASPIKYIKLSPKNVSNSWKENSFSNIQNSFVAITYDNYNNGRSSSEMIARERNFKVL